MQKRYLLWNPGSATVRVGEGIVLRAGGYSSKIFDRDEIDFLKAELLDKHIRICLITPMDPDGRRLLRRQPGEQTAAEVSLRQRELYKSLTGRDFADNVDRIEASRRIELAMTARDVARERNLGRATPPASVPLEGLVEILMNRVFVAVSPNFPKSVEGITVLVNVSGTHIETSDRIAILNLPAEDTVDEMLLAGVVRLCAAAIRGIGQKILIYGTEDASETIAACILREHLAISADQAIQIMKRVKSSALRKSELIRTVQSYRPT